MKSYVLALVSIVAVAGSVRAETPWRAWPAMGGPGWFDIQLDHRMRYESLASDPRATAPDVDLGGLMLRTLLRAELRLPRLQMAVELQDSRAIAPSTTPLTTGIVNTFEPLEAWVGTRLEDVFTSRDTIELRAGRMTLDVGSRRLLARNEYRNTANGFTAFSGTWKTAGGPSLRLIGGVPVTRLPSNRNALRANRAALDEENPGAWIFGAFADGLALGESFQLQLLALGLVERDRVAVPTTNRRLATASVRVLRQPAPGRIDMDLEIIAQLGRSRASTSPTDHADLDHRAFAVHASAGVAFGGFLAPRLRFAFDLASGDADPNDGTQGRFDTIFGARRFEFGPGGLDGLLSRSNVLSPALRLDLGRPQVFDAFVAWRPAWLASARDIWVGVGRQPGAPLPADASFIGHHLEMRVRWFALPGNLALEGGMAALVGGELGLHPGEPVVFAYTQLAVHL